MPAPRFIDTPYRFKRRLHSFLGAIDMGYAAVWQRNLRSHHWLRNCPTDREYIEMVELGTRVRQSWDVN